MKIFLLGLFLLFFLTGCTNTEFKQNSNYQTEKTSTSSEQELFSFSTTIYTKTAERQNNVKLTCNELTGTVVHSGETFSFCDLLRSC